MPARIVEAIFLLAYVFVAPAVIWYFSLGSLAWLIYASTLAIASSIAVAHANLEVKLKGS